MHLRLLPLIALCCSACFTLPAPPLPDAGAGGGGGEAAGGGGGSAVVDAGVPEKFIFFFEASPSMAVSDPTGARLLALQQTLDTLPNDPRISIAVMAFASSTVAVFSPTGLIEFTPMPDFTATERTNIVTRVGTFVPPGTLPPTRDWVRALTTLYEFLYRDTMQALTVGAPLARYTVVFVSDGAPSDNQDDALLCGDAVGRLRWLATSALDVRFHTVHLFAPTQPPSPTCTEDAGVMAGGSSCALPTLSLPVCPGLQVDLNAERLRRMAQLGGGRSLDVRQAPVDFSSLLR
jgi:hypothetical protein